MSNVIKEGGDKKGNVANEAGPAATPVATRRRIPMTLPQMRLAIPEEACPGFHLHWFNGTVDRIQRAQDAGYEFVSRDEVYVNNQDLAGDVAESGNTDLGSRVSMVAGGDIGMDGQAVRLYLMKIKQEWYDEDQEILAERNASIAKAILGGSLKGDGSKETEQDMAKRYMDKRTVMPDLFIPKSQRRR